MNSTARAFLAAALALAGGSSQGSVQKWLPVSNDEFEIAGAFPVGEPVCIGRSGGPNGNPHGFYQWLDASCRRGNRPEERRYIAVWANYGAAESSRSEANGGCPDYDKTGKAQLDITVPEELGWANSTTCDDDETGWSLTVTYFAKAHDKGQGYGPDDILFEYDVTLGTDPAHRTADLRLFAEFLRRLSLAGVRLEPKLKT